MIDQIPEYWTADGVFGVRLEQPAIESILKACRASGRNETGGILVGQYSDDRRLATILHASAPPADSRAGGFWLVRGIRGLQSWLERLWREGAGYYVGEWHFHPFAAPTPSREDVAQMKRIAKSTSYRCEQPILVVIGDDPTRTWSIRVEVHTRRGDRHILSRIQGKPLRTA